MISSYRSLRVIPLISSRLVVVVYYFSDGFVLKSSWKLIVVCFCLEYGYQAT